MQLRREECGDSGVFGDAEGFATGVIELKNQGEFSAEAEEPKRMKANRQDFKIYRLTNTMKATIQLIMSFHEHRLDGAIFGRALDQVGGSSFSWVTQERFASASILVLDIQR